MRVLLALAALALPALGSAVGVGSVHVRIELQGHATQCYIAAVPVEKPNAQPQREDIVDAQAVNWDLPAGRYRILAGAIDHATATSRLITVVPGDMVDVSLTLRPLAAVVGRVLDTDGRGLPNARVGLAGAFRLDFRDKLSALAQQFLQPNTLVATDDMGSFVLPIQTGGTSFVYVEADGHSPQILAGVDASDSHAREVRLGKGAFLNLELDHNPSEYDRVRLIPVGVELPPNLSLSGAVALWTRKLERSPTWRSLPAGHYLLCLGTSNDGSSLTPDCLADIVLHDGEQHLKVHPHAASQPPPAHLAAVTLLLSGAGPASDDAQVFQWEAGRARLVPSESSRDHLRITVRSCLPGVRYVVYSNTTLAASDKIPDCSIEQRLVPYPRSSAKVHLSPPLAAVSPQDGFVRFVPCTASEDEVVVPFSADARGLAEFAAPAGCFTPTLFAPPFAPAQLPLATFAVGEVLDFKTTALRFGATVTGRLLDQRNVPVANAVVWLLSATQVDSKVGPNARAKARPVHIARTDNDGWVKVTGVADGDYIVAFTQLAATLPQTTRRFTVHPEESCFLPDIVAVPRGSLTVLVQHSSRPLPTQNVTCVATPTRDVAWPATWSVSVPAQNSACSFRDLLAGTWLVHAAIGTEQGFSFETAPTRMVINGGSSSGTVDVSQSEYHGVILDRGTPVAGGVLEITPTFRMASPLIRTSIERDGSFRVILAKSGPYSLNIQAPENGALVRLPRVLFAEASSETIINVPQGSISGIVSLDSGDPIKAVTLRLESSADEAGTMTIVARVTSDADGRFAFRFLADGEWTIRTESDQVTSEPAYVTVRNAVQVQPVFLVAHMKR